MTGLVGQPLRRREDERFLLGRGRYMADIVLPGALFLHMVRSPHAHARIGGIDSDAACTRPGVVGVFTAADLAELGPIPCSTAVATEGPMHVPRRYALAADRVRYVGEPVAFTVATSAAVAQDAAEAVDVIYEPLPCVVEAVAALQPGAPLVWDDVPGNLSFRFRKGDRAAVADAMAAAVHTVELELVNNRVIVAPMEHRAALAVYAAASDVWSLTLSGQGVHGIRRDLAEAVFGVPLDRVQVASPDVGGGFGVKNPVYPEYVALLWAARQLGRPVRWACGHGEDFLTTAHGRDNVTRARLGWMRPAASWRSTSTRWPISAPACPPAAPAAPPTRPATRWAPATTSRSCSCPCVAPSPTPCRWTPTAGPASPRRTT